MDTRSYAGAYTLVFEPKGKSNLPIYVASHNDTGSGTDTGSVNQADTGRVITWIKGQRVAKEKAGLWQLGDTGWADDTGGALYPWRAGTTLQVYHRYDTGDVISWDKTAYRVTRVGL